MGHLIGGPCAALLGMSGFEKKKMHHQPLLPTYCTENSYHGNPPRFAAEFV